MVVSTCSDLGSITQLLLTEGGACLSAVGRSSFENDGVINIIIWCKNQWYGYLHELTCGLVTHVHDNQNGYGYGWWNVVFVRCSVYLYARLQVHLITILVMVCFQELCFKIADACVRMKLHSIITDMGD